MNISLIPLNDIQTADDSKKCGYSVYLDNKIQGDVWLYDNPYHTGNRYIKIELNPLKNETSAELFRKIKELAENPCKPWSVQMKPHLFRFWFQAVSSVGENATKPKPLPMIISANDRTSIQSIAALAKKTTILLV